MALLIIQSLGVGGLVLVAACAGEHLLRNLVRSELNAVRSEEAAAQREALKQDGVKGIK